MQQSSICEYKNEEAVQKKVEQYTESSGKELAQITEAEINALQIAAQVPLKKYLDMGPGDIAKALYAFAENDILELELFQTLEKAFLQRIHEAICPEIVILFQAHAVWIQNLVEETLITKDQSRRLYKNAKKYNQLFLHDMLEKLINFDGD